MESSSLDMPTPRNCNSFTVVLISKSFGTLVNVSLSEVNKEPIKIGNAAFFAPEIKTSPNNLLWP